MRINGFFLAIVIALVLVVSTALNCCNLVFAQQADLTSHLLDERTNWKEGQEIRFDSLMSKEWAPHVVNFQVVDGEVLFAGGACYTGRNRRNFESRSGNFAVFRTRFSNVETGEFSNVNPKIVAYCGGPDEGLTDGLLYPKVYLSRDKQVFLLVVNGPGHRPHIRKPEPEFQVPEDRVISEPGLYMETESGLQKVQFPEGFGFHLGTHANFSPEGDKMVFTCSSPIAKAEDLRGLSLEERMLKANQRQVQIVQMNVKTQKFGEVIEFQLNDNQTLGPVDAQIDSVRTIGYSRSFMIGDTPWIQDRVLSGGKIVKRLRDYQGKKELLLDGNFARGQISGEGSNTQILFDTRLRSVTPKKMGQGRFIEFILANDKNSKKIEVELFADEVSLYNRGWAIQGNQVFCIPILKNRQAPMRIIQFSMDDPAHAIRHLFSSEVRFAPNKMIADNGYLYFPTRERMGMVRFPFTSDPLD